MQFEMSVKIEVDGDEISVYTRPTTGAGSQTWERMSTFKQKHLEEESDSLLDVATSAIGDEFAYRLVREGVAL